MVVSRKSIPLREDIIVSPPTLLLCLHSYDDPSPEIKLHSNLGTVGTGQLGEGGWRPDAGRSARWRSQCVLDLGRCPPVVQLRKKGQGRPKGPRRKYQDIQFYSTILTLVTTFKVSRSINPDHAINSVFTKHSELRPCPYPTSSGYNLHGNASELLSTISR